MHLFDAEQHVLIEVAGTLIFLVGVANVAGVGLPVTTELGLPGGLFLTSLGLVLMGYKKLARRIQTLQNRRKNT